MRRSSMKIAAVLFATAAVLPACNASPTGPSDLIASAASPVLDAAGEFGHQASRSSPDDFAARGWECRPSPVPGRRVCSRPNQGFPPVPPTADRPTSFTLLAWDNGEFVGTILLLRPEVYNGQRCESTREPFIFRPVIGYYECVHTVGN